MNNKNKMIITFCLIFSLVLLPCTPALAEYEIGAKEATTESMIGDAVVARPLGLVSMVVGSVFFVVSLPFSALGGNTGEAAEKMVIAPTRFTFNRPLGEF